MCATRSPVICLFNPTAHHAGTVGLMLELGYRETPRGSCGPLLQLKPRRLSTVTISRRVDAPLPWPVAEIFKIELMKKEVITFY